MSEFDPRDHSRITDMTDNERRQARAATLRSRKRGILLMRMLIILLSLVVIALAGLFIYFAMNRGKISEGGQQQNAGNSGPDQAGTAVTAQTDAANDADAADDGSQTQSVSIAQGDTQAQTQAQTPVTEAPAQNLSADSDVMDRAALLAAGYDYDGAIVLLQSIEGYESMSDVTSAISEYEEAKAQCVPIDVTTVPHIFYHSLINDTDRAFNVSVLGQFAVDGMNAWMTTIEEFDRITQQLYDNGYVYVRLRDLVVETRNDDGSVSFTPNTQLMLPPGKKAIVLSVDDLSYYHSYKAAGFPDKLVLDDQGLVKCQYTDANGNTTIGDYDVVPRLNTFLREHPDGSYHGARGLIALTGYNGVFGYRTDEDYELRANLMDDQAAWLAEHPDFNRQEEIAEATVIAEALKSEGWEFASHTWGHLSVTGKSTDTLATDNTKWVNNVQNIVGPTDTIIFAHGNDIGDWLPYAADNDQYNYYKSAGYDFYCNVDGSVPYWVQINDHNVRQGRINLDGYMLYQASQGNTDVLNALIDPVSVFDSRRPTPVVANGQG